MAFGGVVPGYLVGKGKPVGPYQTMMSGFYGGMPPPPPPSPLQPGHVPSSPPPQSMAQTSSYDPQHVAVQGQGGHYASYGGIPYSSSVNYKGFPGVMSGDKGNFDKGNSGGGLVNPGNVGGKGIHYSASTQYPFADSPFYSAGDVGNAPRGDMKGGMQHSGMLPPSSFAGSPFGKGQHSGSVAPQHGDFKVCGFCLYQYNLRRYKWCNQCRTPFPPTSVAAGIGFNSGQGISFFGKGNNYVGIGDPYTNIGNGEHVPIGIDGQFSSAVPGASGKSGGIAPLPTTYKPTPPPPSAPFPKSVPPAMSPPPGSPPLPLSPPQVSPSMVPRLDPPPSRPPIPVPPRIVPPPPSNDTTQDNAPWKQAILRCQSINLHLPNSWPSWFGKAVMLPKSREAVFVSELKTPPPWMIQLIKAAAFLPTHLTSAFKVPFDTASTTTFLDEPIEWEKVYDVVCDFFTCKLMIFLMITH